MNALVHADVAQLPDDKVRDDLRHLTIVANLVQAAMYERVAAFDARGLSGVDDIRTTRAWLSTVGRLSPYAASRLVRQSTVLRELPAVTAATHSGTVTPEHVSKIVGLTDQLGVAAVQAVDESLADLATVSTPAEMERACRKVRDHVHPGRLEPDPASRRDLTITRVGDMIRLHARLDRDAGELVRAALDAMTTTADLDDPRTPGQQRADALTALARLPQVPSPSPPSVGVVSLADPFAGGTSAQRRRRAVRSVRRGSSTPRRRRRRRH